MSRHESAWFGVSASLAHFFHQDHHYRNVCGG
jgi:hypothetical protein